MYYVLVVLAGACFDKISSEFVVEDFHWFSGKRTFIDGGVFMRFNGVLGLLFLLISCGIAFSCSHQCFFLYRGVYKIVKPKSL